MNPIQALAEARKRRSAMILRANRNAAMQGPAELTARYMREALHYHDCAMHWHNTIKLEISTEYGKC